MPGYLPGAFPPSVFPPTFWAAPGPAFAPSRPNSRRLLRVTSPGYAGTFAAYSADSDDVAGFDLTPWVNSLGNPGETLDAINFTMVPISTDATDPAPADRITGLVTIVGNAVGVRLGAWQPGVPYIVYRLEGIAETNLFNQVPFWAYVPVNSPIA